MVNNQTSFFIIKAAVRDPNGGFYFINSDNIFFTLFSRMVFHMFYIVSGNWATILKKEKPGNQMYSIHLTKSLFIVITGNISTHCH
jgi:hypothetical protein